MQREIDRLRQENPFLKNRGLLREETVTFARKYELICSDEGNIRITMMTLLLEAHRSGYLRVETCPRGSDPAQETSPAPLPSLP